MDLEYLGKKPIAILGAGGVGKPCAADCALAGREVRLWDDPRFAPKSLRNIKEGGLYISGEELNLINFHRNGHCMLDMVTDNLAEAVKGAGLIIVATVALGHKALFEKLIPLLEDGQFVHIIPDNYGTLLMRKMMHEAGCTTKVVVGGWGTSPYGARVMVKGGVTTTEISILDRVLTQRGAALPATDTDVFMESAKYFPPFDQVYEADGADPHFGMRRGDTALDVSISNINPVLHVPGVILGVAAMQNFELFGKHIQYYSLYAHGFCPAISKVQDVFYTEQEQVAAAAGTEIAPVEHEYFYSRSNIYGPEYMGTGYMVPFSEDFRNKQIPYGDGPTSLDTRYITEDIPIGCYVTHQLGEKFGVKTPIVDTMITLAETMTGKELCKETGYTLDFLGIGHMSKEELSLWLREGVYTEKK